MHTLVIGSKIVDRENNKKCSKELHKFIYEQCGDNDTKKSNGRQIDPICYFYKGVPLMINSNINLKEGRGNGTLCRGVSVRFKSYYEPICENWDRRNVHCASVDDIEHLTCEYWRKDREKEPQKTFIVKVDVYILHPSISSFSGVQMSF